MYCIVCGQNEMSYRDISAECVKEKWVPLLSITTNPPIIPCFLGVATAKRFAERNLEYKKWLIGVVNLTPRDIEWIKNKGWILTTYNFPQRLRNVTFDVEILEYDEEPELRVAEQKK